MIAGVTIQIGGKSYTLPPLGLAGMKKRDEVLSRVAEADATDFEKTEATVEIVHAALVRNYPDLTLDEVKEKIHAYEVLDLAKALPALYEKSGLKSRGEPKRGAKLKKSNGAKSTEE